MGVSMKKPLNCRASGRKGRFVRTRRSRPDLQVGARVAAGKTRLRRAPASHFAPGERPLNRLLSAVDALQLIRRLSVFVVQHERRQHDAALSRLLYGLHQHKVASFARTRLYQPHAL